MQRGDRVPTLCARSGGKPRGGRVLHRHPRLCLCPEAGHVRHVEQDEHLHAEVDDVDGRKHRRELLVLLLEARLLRHARIVEPDEVDLGVIDEVALERGELHAHGVRLVGLLPPG
eukprot:scaffold79873_cov75-Phaeocystis_antarctica.AAC.1